MPLSWFMALFISASMPPIVIDMPSQEVCKQVLALNKEYKGAKCWAKEKGESIDAPTKPADEDNKF